jgi:hypothetical protein
MGRPELGEITPGQTFVKIDSFRRSRRTRMRVIKVARVWVSVVPEEKAKAGSWTEQDIEKFRKDNQTDGGQTGTPKIYFTEAQYAWHKREALAYEFLREAGISAYQGRYSRDRVTLANLIRAHEGLEAI